MNKAAMFKATMVFAATIILCLSYSRAFAQGGPVFSPDNSAINVRDRSRGAVTADSQSSSKNDLELTARVRRAIIKDKSLSVMAQNVKVISTDGQVTLRGPVKSDQEKNAIVSDVQGVAGVIGVDDRLEIVTR
jgi:hyperosmotically inducible periplasmic protein